jgi:hypothetical protein
MYKNENTLASIQKVDADDLLSNILIGADVKFNSLFS